MSCFSFLTLDGSVKQAETDHYEKEEILGQNRIVLYYSLQWWNYRSVSKSAPKWNAKYFKLPNMK